MPILEESKIIAVKLPSVKKRTIEKRIYKIILNKAFICMDSKPINQKPT
jgi:hypothetical protein